MGRACARAISFLVVAITLLLASPSFAVQPDEMLSDPGLEARARTISREVRCMVCQNQSIDDSEATLAHDLRLLVRERINAGDTDQQVLDFLVARYGPFVLLKPRFGLDTALLWLMPAGVLLIGGCGFAAFLLRRRRLAGDEEPRLTAAEQGRLEELLDDRHELPGSHS